MIIGCLKLIWTGISVNYFFEVNVVYIYWWLVAGARYVNHLGLSNLTSHEKRSRDILLSFFFFFAFKYIHYTMFRYFCSFFLFYNNNELSVQKISTDSDQSVLSGCTKWTLFILRQCISWILHNFAWTTWDV